MGRRRLGKRANGEGSVYQRADGRWTATLTLGFNAAGRQIRRHVYGRTQAEALDRLEKLKRDHAEGRPVTSERITVARFLERWLAEAVSPTHVRHKTTVTYTSFVKSHLIPGLGSIELRKLQTIQVQHFLNERSGAGLSPTTVKHLRDCLRAACNVAIQWGLLAHNPAANAKPPQRAARKPRSMSEADAQRFLEAIHGHRMEALLMTTLCLGLRQGEVLGLRQEDIDFDRRILHVRGALQRVPVEGDKTALKFVATKTEDSQRSILFPDVVAQGLQDHLARQREEQLAAGADWRDTGFLFTTHIGTPLEAANMLKEFRAILRKHNLPRIRFHDLRHSAATLLRARGVPTPLIAKLLGHSTPQTTENVYSHVIPEMESRAAETMDKIFGGEPAQR
jgi:integrase